MKKINLFKIGINLFGLIFMMTLFTGISAVLSGAAGLGATIAVGAVIASEPVTVQDVKAGSADLDTSYISKVITEMRPAATPLDTILRNINKDVKIESFKSDFYSVSTRPLYDTVKTQYTKAGDGHATTALNVNTISMWTVDDTCLFRGITGSDGLDLMCLVVDKSVSNATITIQPMNGTAGSGTTAGLEIIPATIPVNTRIVRCGPAKNELDAQTSPYAIIPVKDYNYMQIFMAQVEESVFQKMHSKEVQWNFKDYQVQSIYDMRATMEFSYIFGVRKQFPDAVNAKERYTTGGIWRSITKSLEYGTGGTDRTIDNATFVDWTKSIFTGNSGADTRFVFAGDGLMANLAKVDTIIKQIEAKQTEVKFGITFNQIETNFGKLLIKHHPLLDQANYGDYGLVLDLNHIEKHVMKPMSTRPLSLRESGQRNVDAVVIEETSGVIVTYPDTHGIIGPKA